MKANNHLLRLLRDFCKFRARAEPQAINQIALLSWDLLAMVQLAAELQGTFSAHSTIGEIQALRSFDEIGHALRRRGISLNDAGA